MNDMKTSSLPGSTGAGPDLTQRFALDVQGFDRLRQTARDDPHAAAKTVAKEMNASFLSMMLKSMRDATPSDGITDSQDGKTYQSMLDGQLTQDLSSKGVGLADSLLKQLGGNIPEKHDAAGGGKSLASAAPIGAKGALGAVGAVGAVEGKRGAAAANHVGPADAASVTRTATMTVRGSDGDVASAQISHTVASAGTMHDRARLSMEERVAAVEAAAMAAGWRPAQQPSAGASGNGMAGIGNMRDLAALGTEARIAAASIGGAPRGVPQASEANTNLDDAKPFAETESGTTIRLKGASANVNAFIAKLAPAAEAASRETGIPSHFILSQVALESGWGKSEIRTPGGERTHNVLGVKAGDSWKGPTVTATTTEYIHGRPHHVRETFRVYGSYKEALQDYANVLKSNSRFQPALRASNTASGFAHGMQNAGYATDPHYARKLLAIIKQMV